MSRKSYTSNTRARTQTHSRRSLILFCIGVFVTTGLTIGGIYAWRWMQKPTTFPITQITVQGQLTHVSPTVIEHIVQTQLTGGFFSLHVSAAKQAILAFPWIADVSFRRVWPHTLNVHVIEQQAVARFGAKGVLNTEGAVFYPDIKSLPQNLPDLEGPIDQSLVLLNFYRTANTLAQLLGLTVISLHLNTEQSWDLMLSNQVKVVLGRQQALERFKRFVTIYPKIKALSDKTIVSVDLRYANGVAVKYQDK